MTPKEQAEAEHDPLHEDTIRNRRRIAPGHWSNSDIDCLLRRLDEARTAAADARRQAIEECVRLCKPSRIFEETVGKATDAAALSCVSIVRREVRIVEKAIRALLPPASEEPERDR